MYKILFTVRRQYFDAIVSGEKTMEVRRASQRWRTIYHHALFLIRREHEQVVGVFMCGRSIHRREITDIHPYANPKAALGRDPSWQGKLDLGIDEVFGFELGGVVAQ